MPKSTPQVNDRHDISIFMKNLWFFLMFLFLMMLIASFGLIAEA